MRWTLRRLARRVLGFERSAEVRLDGGALSIGEERRLFGRERARRSTLLPLAALASLTLVERGAARPHVVGLVALGLGTTLGTGVLAHGLRLERGAPSMLGLGLFLLLGGVLVDALLDAWALRRAHEAPVRVRVLPRRGPAWVVTTSDRDAARELLRTVEAALQPN